MSNDLRQVYEISGKSQHRIIAQHPVLPRNEIFDSPSKNTSKNKNRTSRRIAPFHRKTRVCPKYFVYPQAIVVFLKRLYIWSRQVVSTLVLKYFVRNLFGYAIKRLSTISVCWSGDMLYLIFYRIFWNWFPHHIFCMIFQVKYS